MLTALIILIVISAIQTYFAFFHMAETMKLRDTTDGLPMRITSVLSAIEKQRREDHQSLIAAIEHLRTKRES